jgi:hypothetical protein
MGTVMLITLDCPGAKAAWFTASTIQNLTTQKIIEVNQHE